MSDFDPDTKVTAEMAFDWLSQIEDFFSKDLDAYDLHVLRALKEHVTKLGIDTEIP